MKNRVLAQILTLIMAMNLLPVAAVPAYSASSDRYTAKEYADYLVDNMSTTEKAAQMLLVRTPQKDAAKLQKQYQFGGYLLFAVDFSNKSPSSLKKMVSNWQNKSKTKMLIAVDEEGGTVVRASLYPQFRSSRFKSPREVYSSGGWSGITKYTASKDKFLLNLGINTNLAPVADITYSKGDYMYYRAFSEKEANVSKFVRLTADQMKKDKVVCSLKHFPGYGGNGNTHYSLIRDKRSMSAYEKRDLKPFKAGIKHDADMIMVSHIIVNAFDSKRPASMSKAVHKYLRGPMNYKGVIITDGLDMEGVRKYAGGDKGETAVKAIRAGNTMLIVDSEPVKVLRSIKRAIADGRISRKTVDKCARRIVLMKIKKGIIKVPAKK